jgi:hypothetical protein
VALTRRAQARVRGLPPMGMTLPLWPLHSRGVDAERAQTYGLIAGLLSQPADRALLQLVARTATPLAAGGRFDAVWERLRLAALGSDPVIVARDHELLFDAHQEGGPRVDLRARAYRDGPVLRTLLDDLATCGLEARVGHGDEDRLHALCEDMQWLLDTESPLPPAQRWQYRFFDRHLAPWYATALRDLHDASDTPFYRALADTALAFLDFEALTGAGEPLAR